MSELSVFSPDEDIESADWTKHTWDLPPYKSREFLSLFPDLAAFRKLPVYKNAVKSGLICDDEWLADYVEPFEKAKPKTLAPQIVGNAGLYFCCYHLSLLGWNVMPTARNARGVDIIAYSQNASTKLAIQVKALSKRNPVPLGTSLTKVMGDYWIIVTNIASSPRAYILTPSEVSNLAHEGNKDEHLSYWLQPSAYDKDQFREAWERIGHGA